MIADACMENNQPVYIIALEGHASQDIYERADAICKIEKVSKIAKLLKQAACAQLAMVGKVNRPDFMKLRPDAGGIQVLAQIARLKIRGDDALLRILADYFTKKGFSVLAPENLLEGLRAPEGLLCGTMQNVTGDIALGQDILAATSRFDMGQGVVVCRGLILALEGAEGTDAMLARCAALPEAMRGTKKKRDGIVMKLPKKGQDKRLDLPGIGVETITNAAAAGLAGIVFEAGGAHIIDLPACIACAQEKGLFLYGLTEST